MIQYIKKIIDNEYVFSVVAKVISVFSGIVYSVLFARYLGPELRGEAAVILNYSEMISLVLCLGIYQAYPYFKKITGKDLYMEFINYIFGLLLLYMLIAIVLICLFDWKISIALSILLAPILMGIKQLNYFVLIENPKIRNTANIKLDLFDIMFLSILLITTDADYGFCVFFLVTKHLVFFIIACLNLKVNFLKIRPTLRGVLPYAKYGVVPMITVILMEVNYKIDVIILERLHVNAVDIGIYSLGVMLAQKLWMIPDALKDILLSKLAKGKTKKEVAKVTRLSFWITVVMVVGMIAFGKSLICIMYGSEFVDSYMVTVTILAGVLGMVFYKMVYSYNVANGRKNVNLVLLGSAAIINIVSNVIAIPYWGIMGSATASLISCCLCGLSFLAYFCYTTKTSVIDMLFLKRDDINSIKQFIHR